jgi:hypothetical protein
MQNLFSFRSTNYNLRYAEMKLNLPKPCTDYLKCTVFATMGHGYGIYAPLILPVQLIH